MQHQHCCVFKPSDMTDLKMFFPVTLECFIAYCGGSSYIFVVVVFFFSTSVYMFFDLMILHLIDLKLIINGQWTTKTKTKKIKEKVFERIINSIINSKHQKHLPILIEVFRFLNFKRAKDKGPYHNTFVPQGTFREADT